MTWDAVHDQASADIKSDAAGYAAGLHHTVGAAEVWSIRRTVMQFDTSVLAGKTVLGVSIELFLRQPEDTRDVTIYIVDHGTISDSYPFPLSDYGKIGTTSYGNDTYTTGTGGQWYRIALDASLIPLLNRSGNTILCAREANDLNDSEPTIDETIAARAPWFQDDAGTCCRLIVAIADAEPPAEPPPAPGINRTLYCDWTAAAPVQDRNWCPNWTTAATSMALSRRPDGTLAILFGTCDGTGRILRLDSSLHADDGEAFESSYQTAFAGGSSGRNSFQYLTASCAGEGELEITAILPDGITVKALRNLEMKPKPLRDSEWRGIRVNSERVGWRFGVRALNAWFKMRKLVPYARPHPWSRTIGGPS